MRNIKIIQTLDILHNIYNLSIKKPCQNERYLHHYFTEKIQKDYPIYFEDISQSRLHPEWATANQYRVQKGKYKKNEKKYEISDDGTSGFIDFALGDYNYPEVGIEFKSNSSWQFEPIVFDFMKLLDINNNLQTAISFSIIYRKNELSSKLTFDKINNTITEVKNRLKGRLNINRPFIFWIVEIAYNNEKTNSWYCDNLDEKFIIGIPKFTENEIS